MSENEPQPSDQLEEVRRKHEMAAIENALRGLRFGSVNLIVQDGVVIQIDRLEKRRLQRRNSEKLRE